MSRELTLEETRALYAQELQRLGTIIGAKPTRAWPCWRRLVQQNHRCSGSRCWGTKWEVQALDHLAWFRLHDGGWLLLTQPYQDPSEYLAEWCPPRGLDWLSLPWSPYATSTHAALIFGANERDAMTNQPLAVFLRDRLNVVTTTSLTSPTVGSL